MTVDEPADPEFLSIGFASTGYADPRGSPDIAPSREAAGW